MEGKKNYKTILLYNKKAYTYDILFKFSKDRDIDKFILMFSLHIPFSNFLNCTLTLNPAVSPLADKVPTIYFFANEVLK